MIFIIRSGITIIADHPRFYWTRHSTPGKEWFRIQNPVPPDPLYTAKQDSITVPDGVGLPGRRHSIRSGAVVAPRCRHTLAAERDRVLGPAACHGSVDAARADAVGQRLAQLPVGGDPVPSLDWPTENGWVNYNSLQVIAYFVTVFVAAPLALITGLGMSPALSTRFRKVSSVLSIQVARSLHFLVLCWFLMFIVLHVTLVLTTGALRNLNHMK